MHIRLLMKWRRTHERRRNVTKQLPLMKTNLFYQSKQMAQNLFMLMVQIHLMTVAAYHFIMTWITFMVTSLTRPPKVMIRFGFSYVVFIFIWRNSDTFLLFHYYNIYICLSYFLFYWYMSRTDFWQENHTGSQPVFLHNQFAFTKSYYHESR